jgi:hypothetical protein
MTPHRKAVAFRPWSDLLPKGSQARWLLIGGLIVLVVGFIASLARVEFSSPFTARLAAVTVRFFEAGKGREVTGNLFQLWQLAQRHRLAYFVTVHRFPPRYLPVILQSLLGWLCLWLAVGLVGLALRCPMPSLCWWQLGGWLGCLFIGRLLQIISVSAWLWFPHERPNLLNALVDMALGLPLPSTAYAALFWRISLWLLSTLLLPICLFFLLRIAWHCSKGKAFVGTLLTIPLASVLYRLATFWE